MASTVTTSGGVATATPVADSRVCEAIRNIGFFTNSITSTVGSSMPGTSSIHGGSYVGGWENLKNFLAEDSTQWSPCCSFAETRRLACDPTTGQIVALNVSLGGIPEMPIPQDIPGLASLKVLDMSGNALKGNIPFNINNLSQLEYLDLSNNQLSGEIPPSLFTLSKLTYVDLSHNKFEGRFPYTISNVGGTLQYFNVGINCFNSTTNGTATIIQKFPYSFNGYASMCPNGVGTDIPDIFTLLHQLPKEIQLLIWVTMATGTLIIIGIVFGCVCCVRRRRRLKNQQIAEMNSKETMMMVPISGTTAAPPLPPRVPPLPPRAISASTSSSTTTNSTNAPPPFNSSLKGVAPSAPPLPAPALPPRRPSSPSSSTVPTTTPSPISAPRTEGTANFFLSAPSAPPPSTLTNSQTIKKSGGSDEKSGGMLPGGAEDLIPGNVSRDVRVWNTRELVVMLRAHGVPDATVLAFIERGVTGSSLLSMTSESLTMFADVLGLQDLETRAQMAKLIARLQAQVGSAPVPLPPPSIDGVVSSSDGSTEAGGLPSGVGGGGGGGMWNSTAAGVRVMTSATSAAPAITAGGDGGVTRHAEPDALPEYRP